MAIARPQEQPLLLPELLRTLSEMMRRTHVVSTNFGICSKLWIYNVNYICVSRFIIYLITGHLDLKRVNLVITSSFFWNIYKWLRRL